jgi:hypothetical protein
MKDKEREGILMKMQEEKGEGMLVKTDRRPLGHHKHDVFRYVYA